MTTPAPPLAANGPNADQIDYWNGDAGERWARYQDKLDAMLQGLFHHVGEVAALGAIAIMILARISLAAHGTTK